MDTAPDDLPVLILALAGGDQRALRAIYQRQSVRLFGVANAILRDRDTASDALHDAFVHGLSHAQVAARLDEPLGTVKAWIRHGLLRLRECLA